ncbi:hypothetical protein BJX99DRAFT_228880 [Aspergillus californicus]
MSRNEANVCAGSQAPVVWDRCLKAGCYGLVGRYLISKGSGTVTLVGYGHGACIAWEESWSCLGVGPSLHPVYLPREPVQCPFPLLSPRLVQDRYIMPSGYTTQYSRTPAPSSSPSLPMSARVAPAAPWPWPTARAATAPLHCGLRNACTVLWQTPSL